MKCSINSPWESHSPPPESRAAAPPSTLEGISGPDSDYAQRPCRPKARSSEKEHGSQVCRANATSAMRSAPRSKLQNHRTTLPRPCGRASRSRALRRCMESPVQSPGCCNRETRRRRPHRSAPPVVSTTGRTGTARQCTRPAALSPVAPSHLLDATACLQDELSCPRADIGNPAGLC
jgi:hypothetical protein